MFLMNAPQRIILLASLAVLTLAMESCIYPPFAPYSPPRRYHARAYYDDYYPPPPRHYYRKYRPQDAERFDEDAPPPPQRDSSSDRKSDLRPAEKTPPTLSGDPIATPKKEVPTATRTNNPNRVKSPYPPYEELDVSGLPSGSLAKDPATGEKFRVP
jgi:hypothetical protein